MNEAEVIAQKFSEVWDQKVAEKPNYGQDLLVEVFEELINTRVITHTSVLLGKIIVFGETWEDIIKEATLASQNQE